MVVASLTVNAPDVSSRSVVTWNEFTWAVSRMVRVQKPTDVTLVSDASSTSIHAVSPSLADDNLVAGSQTMASAAPNVE